MLLSILQFLRGFGLVWPVVVLLVFTINGADLARRGRFAELGWRAAFALAACLFVFVLFVWLPTGIRRRLRAHMALSSS